MLYEHCSQRLRVSHTGNEALQLENLARLR